MRYSGESCFTFSTNAAWASELRGAGASVLAPTAVPTAVKKFSWPGGVHMHNNRAGTSAALRKACGSLAGTLAQPIVQHLTSCSQHRVDSFFRLNVTPHSRGGRDEGGQPKVATR